MKDLTIILAYLGILIAAVAFTTSHISDAHRRIDRLEARIIKLEVKQKDALSDMEEIEKKQQLEPIKNFRIVK